MNLFILEMMRVNNFNTENLEEKLAEIWQKAKEKVNEETEWYAVYTDYTSNYKGDYSYGIALRQYDSNSLVCIDKSMRYKVFRVKDKSHLSALWEHVWELEESGSIRRAYTVDYEHYNVDGTVDVYVAIEA